MALQVKLIFEHSTFEAIAINSAIVIRDKDLVTVKNLELVTVPRSAPVKKLLEEISLQYPIEQQHIDLLTSAVGYYGTYNETSRRLCRSLYLAARPSRRRGEVQRRMGYGISTMSILRTRIVETTWGILQVILNEGLQCNKT